MMNTVSLTLVVICLVLAVTNGFKQNSFHAASSKVIRSLKVNNIVATSIQIQPFRMDLSLQAKKKEPAPVVEEEVKKEGIEPKYLGALGVFLFAALYDFFITHGGQPYLAHPPVL